MAENLDKITSWAKRRGFVFPGSEIYGGISGVYDLGPYGTVLKNNIKKLWWKTFVENRDDVVGIDSAILMNRKVWQASGHEKGFVDELVECKKCHRRYKADDIDKEKCEKGGEHELTEPKNFNPMFKTYIGAVEDVDNVTYLRPETAQGMFTNFKQVMEVSRKKIPFGIAQIGKSFRNEIMTKDFLFRMREFEIAELEYFVKQGEDEKAFDVWLKNWEEFILSLGVKKENIIRYEHPKEKLAHYSKRTIDLNFKFPFGEKELAGVANRTDFDLKSHQEASGKDLNVFEEESGNKYLPYVIEPTVGIERLMLAVICDTFEEFPNGRNQKDSVIASEATQSINPDDNDRSPLPDGARDDTNIETVLHFKPQLAPVKIAILPLVKKLSNEAQEIYHDLKNCYSDIEFDESGSIGRRYRRQDEIGTPYCVTVDFDSLDDKKVTVRDRDSMKQDRIDIKELKNYFWEKLI